MYNTLGWSLAHADLWGIWLLGGEGKGVEQLMGKGWWKSSGWNLNNGGMLSGWLAKGWMDGRSGWRKGGRVGACLGGIYW